MSKTKKRTFLSKKLNRVKRQIIGFYFIDFVKTSIEISSELFSIITMISFNLIKKNETDYWNISLLS